MVQTLKRAKMVLLIKNVYPTIYKDIDADEIFVVSIDTFLPTYVHILHLNKYLVDLTTFKIKLNNKSTEDKTT